MTDTTAGEGVIIPRSVFDACVCMAKEYAPLSIAPHLSKALAAQPSAGAQGGGAVAWGVQRTDGTWEASTDRERAGRWAMHGHYVHALVSRDATPAQPDTGGWIVGNAADDHWRTWVNGNPDWTSDRDLATRYYRREDAEQVHAGDEDAWRVTPYGKPEDGGA